MKTSSALSALAGVLLLAGCATVPTEPSVMALPGTGKTFTDFRVDDADCRNFAQSLVGAPDEQVANDPAVRSAVVGTVIGALAGALLGGRHGAGVGAGTGLVVGSMSGAGASQSSSYGTQRQYDNAYVQCMYSKGQRVPVSGSFVQSQPVVASPAPASAPAYLPPPPAGYPPPPPLK